MGIIFLAGCSGLQFPAADASQAETSAEYAWETSKLKDDPIWADPQSVKAMIISDLHYTEYKEVDPVLVPGIALAGEITDTIAAEVIDRHPDVLIMTGDNTNSGYKGRGGPNPQTAEDQGKRDSDHYYYGQSRF